MARSAANSVQNSDKLPPMSCVCVETAAFEGPEMQLYTQNYYNLLNLLRQLGNAAFNIIIARSLSSKCRLLAYRRFLTLFHQALYTAYNLGCLSVVSGC